MNDEHFYNSVVLDIFAYRTDIGLEYKKFIGLRCYIPQMFQEGIPAIVQFEPHNNILSPVWWLFGRTVHVQEEQNGDVVRIETDTGVAISFSH